MDLTLCILNFQEFNWEWEGLPYYFSVAIYCFEGQIQCELSTQHCAVLDLVWLQDFQGTGKKYIHFPPIKLNTVHKCFNQLCLQNSCDVTNECKLLFPLLLLLLFLYSYHGPQRLNLILFCFIPRYKAIKCTSTVSLCVYVLYVVVRAMPAPKEVSLLLRLTIKSAITVDICFV